MSCTACNRPGAAAVALASVLALVSGLGAAGCAVSPARAVVDARTFQVLDSGLSPSPPPVSPASLGPVTYLTGHPH